MKTLFSVVVLAVGLAANAQLDLPDLAKIKIAAEAGDAEAQDKLAEKFRSHGDTAQAIVWYRKAAAQNYVHAQGKLGNILLMRYEMHLDTKPEVRGAVAIEARKWITLAANAGDKPAQADLAQLCLKGSLVRLDYVEAYKWSELAAQGSPFEPSSITGKSVRDSAILKMNAAQIEEARKRANSFVPQPAAAPPAKEKAP
jgi:hypothetical protein